MLAHGVANRLLGAHSLTLLLATPPTVLANRHNLIPNCNTKSGSYAAPADISPIPWVDASSIPDPPAVEYDAVLVLGGGQKTVQELPEVVQRRLDAAIGLQRSSPGEPPIVCLGGGSPHNLPLIDDDGHVLHEATQCASYLMEQGISASAILKEISSHDTVGNAYFSATIHVLPAGWRHVAVVTSDFHMPRTRAIFDTVYQLMGQDFRQDKNWYVLSYFPVSDEGVFSEDVLDARRAKEARAAERWHLDSDALRSMTEFHTWLYETHLCYGVPRQHEYATATKELPSQLKASY